VAHDVFISYASPDRAVAEPICAALESVNIQCWIAPRNVRVGKVWVEAIVDAIDESRIFLLLLSSNSNSSPQVIREVERAASKNITIVPIKIDVAPMSKGMEFFISRHQWLNVQVPLRKQDLDELIQTIQQLLAEDIRFRTRRDEEERARLEAQRLAKEKEEREAAERARQQAEEARKSKEAEDRARKEAERLTREKEEREAAERARQQAEEARKAKEIEEKARKEAERLAEEKEEIEVAERARQQAEEVRKAKVIEEKTRKEAERLAKEKEKKEAAERARQQAEETRKAREAEEKARKEAVSLAKEKEQREAREATARARQQAKETPEVTEKPAQKFTKSAWFWAGILFFIISVVMMFILPIINIDKSALSEEALRAQIGVMLVGVLSAAVGVFFLWRSLVKANISRHTWLRSGDAFFSTGMVLPFALLFIIAYGANRITGAAILLPEYTLSLPVILGSCLTFVIPAIFSLRRGLTQESQLQVIKLTQIKSFWARLILLVVSLVIPIVFTVLISRSSDPEEAQSVGLGIMLVSTILPIICSYYFWRGLVKSHLSKRDCLWLAGAFLSVGVVLPFVLLATLLSGTIKTAPRWDLILPPVLLVSLPLIVTGIYSLKQGLVKSTLWAWSGLAVVLLIAAGSIGFVFIVGPGGLQPAPQSSTQAPPSTTLLPAKLTWKISMPFSKNFIENGPIQEWVEDIKTGSNGEWRIEIYYDEQLAAKGKALDGIKNGSFQGAVVSSRFSSEIPLMTVLQNPFLSPSDITQQGEWLMAVAQYPSIMEELSNWNAQVLFPICSPPYNFMGNVPLRTADDFVGRKINCYNRGAQALSAFGALPYEMQTNQLRSALENGIVDSVSRPWSIGFVADKLYEVSKYATIGIDLIIEDMYLAINKDAWEALPDEWKKLCQDAAPKAIARYAKCYAEADLTYIPVFGTAGIEIIDFPEAERAKLVTQAAGVWEKWVAEMVEKGLPGQDVLNFAKAKRDEIMAGKTQ
jgi:TRAP-type C4-dicarboxylate transport system substrate-binding protein